MNYTVVAATSRTGSVSAVIATHYVAVLQELGVPAKLLDLNSLPSDLLETTLYKKVKAPNPTWDAIQELTLATDKFVFIIPEYNGSFPGVLKVYIDALRFPISLKGKKAALVGLSDGTQGSALAMGHFADVLNYAGVHTLALRPRFIQIGKHMGPEGLTNEEYWQFMRLQAEQFVAF